MNNEVEVSINQDNQITQQQVVQLMQENPKQLANYIVGLGNRLNEQSAAYQHLKQQVQAIKSTMRISRAQAEQLAFAAKSTVINTCRGEDSPAYQSRLKQTVYHYLWQEFHEEFGVASYTEVTNQDFEKALLFIKEWAPEMDLIMEIFHFNKE